MWGIIVQLILVMGRQRLVRPALVHAKLDMKTQMGIMYVLLADQVTSRISLVQLRVRRFEQAITRVSLGILMMVKEWHPLQILSHLVQELCKV